VNFAKPKQPLEAVNAAARKLIGPIEEDFNDWGSYLTAIDVVNNWRAAHAYPLHTLTMNLRGTTRRLTEDPLIAQRIKRLPSILLKLRLHPKMKLSQMQDLGGCRAILSDVESVKRIANYYERESNIKHLRQPTDDYITCPKSSGYRGVHLIYRYNSDKSRKLIYNGMKIEIQVRTKYQHAWATAVETVGMFSGQALKSSLGSVDWQRFFALMGSVIALREKSPLVAGTPTNRNELIADLNHYARSLQVSNRLREYGRALHALSSAPNDAYFYLLKLDPLKGTLDVSGFPVKEMELAEKTYAEAEVAAKDHGGDVVLVSVDSINALGKAYPNYFADTRLFVELMEQAIRGRSRGIKVPDRKLQIQGVLPFASQPSSSI